MNPTQIYARRDLDFNYLIILFSILLLNIPSLVFHLNSLTLNNYEINSCMYPQRLFLTLLAMNRNLSKPSDALTLNILSVLLTERPLSSSSRAGGLIRLQAKSSSVMVWLDVNMSPIARQPSKPNPFQARFTVRRARFFFRTESGQVLQKERSSYQNRPGFTERKAKLVKMSRFYRQNDKLAKVPRV